MLLTPWHLLLMSIAGWLNRELQRRLEYLKEENGVLREKLGRRRIVLNDDQRRRLMVGVDGFNGAGGGAA